MSPQKKNVLMLVAGLAATVAVQVLAGGHWSHAVWAPSLIMLAVPLTKQVDGVSLATKKKVLIALGLASAGGVELLAQGRWAHAVWAPTLLMLFTDLVKVSGVDNLATDSGLTDARLDERLRKPAADDVETPPERPKAA